MKSKWGKQYWADLGERVGSTLIYQIITLLTLETGTNINSFVIWTIVGLPTVLAVLKGLLVNLRGSEPTASVVNVTSNGEPVA